MYKYIEKQLNYGIKQVDLKIEINESLDEIAEGIMDYLLNASVGNTIKSFSRIINHEQNIIHYKFY